MNVVIAYKYVCGVGLLALAIVGADDVLQYEALAVHVTENTNSLVMFLV